MTENLEEVSADDGLWLSISDLATRKGLTKQTVGERVARLEAAGRLMTRPGKGRAKLVNLATFDRAAGETADLGRVQAAATRRLMAEPAVTGSSPPVSTDPIYAREQARRVAYQADLAKLELDERRGKLLRADEMTGALTTCTSAIAGIVDRLPMQADDWAALVGREGSHGLRVALKAHAVRMRSEMANALGRVMVGAPESDPPFGEDDRRDANLSSVAGNSAPLDEATNHP